MAQTTQISFEPGSSSSTLAQFLRQVTYQITPPINFEITTATPLRAIATAEVVGFQIAPFSEAIKAGLTDTVLRALSGPAIAALPVAGLGVAEAVPATEVSIRHYGKIPVYLQAGGAATFDADGIYLPIYAVCRTLNTTVMGAAPNGSNLQWMFCVEGAGVLTPVGLNAGLYKAGFSTITQDRHRGMIRFADGALNAELVEPPVETVLDEIQISSASIVPAGEPINITSGAAGFIFSNPTGQAFALDYTSLSTYASDASLSVIVAGQLAVKGAINLAPSSAAETFVERLSASQIRLSVDLYPGSLVRLIRPRVAVPEVPALVLPPFTQAVLTIPIADSSPSPVVISFAHTSSNLFLELTSSNGSQVIEMPASGVPASFVDTGTGRAIRILAGGLTSGQASTNATSARYAIGGINGSNLTYGGATIQDYSGGGTGMNGSVTFGQNTSSLIKFAVNSILSSIDYSDGTLTGFAGDSDGAGPDNGILNVRTYSALRSLDLSNNSLDAAAIAALLAAINDSNSLVRNLSLDLSGNPGAGSINLSLYPNLSAYGVTTIGLNQATTEYTSILSLGTADAAVPVRVFVTATAGSPLSARLVARHPTTDAIIASSPVASGQYSQIAFPGQASVTLELESSTFANDRSRITELRVEGFGGATPIALTAMRSAMTSLNTVVIAGGNASSLSFFSFPDVSLGIESYAASGVGLSSLLHVTSLGEASRLELLDLSNNNLSTVELEALLSELNLPGSVVTNATINISNNPGSGAISLGTYANLAGKNITVIVDDQPVEILSFLVADGSANLETPALTYTGGGALTTYWLMEDGAGNGLASVTGTGGAASPLVGAGTGRKVRLMADDQAIAIAEASRITSFTMDDPDTLWESAPGLIADIHDLSYYLPNLTSFTASPHAATSFYISGKATVSSIDVSNGALNSISNITGASGLRAMSGLRTLDISSNDLPASVVNTILSTINEPSSSVHDLVIDVRNNPNVGLIDVTSFSNFASKNITVMSGGVV